MSFAAYGVALQLINKKKIKMRNYRKRNYLEIRPLQNIFFGLSRLAENENESLNDLTA